MKAAGLEPLVPYPGSAAPWLCRCTRCGDEVSPQYSGIRNGQGGCRVCGKLNGALTQKEGNVQAATDIMIAAGLRPLVLYPGTGEPWLCRCESCGAEVTPQHANVVQGHHGCRFCANIERGLRRREPYAIPAIAAMRALRLEPLVDYPNSMTPWLCRCLKCGREVTPTYSNAMNQKGGCRWCAPRGADPSVPGFVYLMTHIALGAHKIGIRNVGTNRIESHQRYGWTLYRERSFDLTDDALKVESAILRWWRQDLIQPPYLHADDMPQGGWTETVSADAVSLPDVWVKVCELAAMQQTGEPDFLDDEGVGQLALF